MKKEISILIVLAVVLVGCFQPFNPPTNSTGGGTGSGAGDTGGGTSGDGGTDGGNSGEETEAGTSYETAIVITAETSSEGIGMENDWIELNGCKNQGGPVSKEMQELGDLDNGHTYDLIHVMCANGEVVVYYFQIDSFFGSWE